LILVVASREIVTVIETLSPTNDRNASDYRKQYLAKREQVLGGSSHLVEFDLLRGGERLPIKNCPPGDFFALISRAHQTSTAEIHLDPPRSDAHRFYSS
jgi:hypothetical protein